MSNQIGKEKEDASRITSHVANPSTQDILRPHYPNFSNYMHGYYSPVPQAWVPSFVPPPNANPYSWNNQQSGSSTALSNSVVFTSSATLYSSTIPVMGPPPTTYLFPWSNQQHPWNSTFFATSSSVATSSSIAMSSSATLNSSTALYSSVIPMMRSPPTAYPFPWSNQQYPWMPTSDVMPTSATSAAMPTSPTMPSSATSAVMPTSATSASSSVASSSCSTLPAFLPPTNANTYLCGSEEDKAQQSHSAEAISDASLDSIDIEAQSTVSLGNAIDTKEVGSSETLSTKPTSGCDITEEPKAGMSFESENELVAYYNQYGKQCGFGIMTQKSKREKDGTILYVTLGCAHGGKAQNRTSNVSIY